MIPMHIESSILKAYLSHVYFITGTAYAGKSTTVNLLSRWLDVTHCEENYQLNKFLKIATPELFPNLCYFKTMESWEAFVTRTPEAYASWLEGTARELAQFEITELLSMPKEKPIIVDTNIPLDILREISDYDRVIVMLADPKMSVERFFEREDPEKQFILKEIKKTKDPESTLENFKEALRKANSETQYKTFEDSGFKVLKRDSDNLGIEDQAQEALDHFNLHRWKRGT